MGSCSGGKCQAAGARSFSFRVLDRIYCLRLGNIAMRGSAECEWGLAASDGQARSCESGRRSCTAEPKGIHSLAKEHTLVPVCRDLRCWARMKRVKNLYARPEPGPRILMLCPKRYCSSALAAGSV